MNNNSNVINNGLVSSSLVFDNTIETLSNDNTVTSELNINDVTGKEIVSGLIPVVEASKDVPVTDNKRKFETFVSTYNANLAIKFSEKTEKVSLSVYQKQLDSKVKAIMKDENVPYFVAFVRLLDNFLLYFSVSQLRSKAKDFFNVALTDDKTLVPSIAFENAESFFKAICETAKQSNVYDDYLSTKHLRIVERERENQRKSKSIEIENLSLLLIQQSNYRKTLFDRLVKMTDQSSIEFVSGLKQLSLHNETINQIETSLDLEVSKGLEVTIKPVIAETKEKPETKEIKPETGKGKATGK